MSATHQDMEWCGSSRHKQFSHPSPLRQPGVKSPYHKQLRREGSLYPLRTKMVYGVTGVGAPFGVLRYPLMLFLPAVKTTTS